MTFAELRAERQENWTSQIDYLASLKAGRIEGMCSG
jgi:hypothetical protein